jgi:WD40 repeat protein/serine/threonine protein kinase/DNA-binding XRE family transcriptional regulator
MSQIESFGQAVRIRRRELGLTQDELAHRVGCAPITLRKIEHDDLRPSVQVAERLAMALNIPLEERAAFVRLARTERAPELFTPTPAPQLEEIGAEDLTGRAVRGYALAERIGAGGMGAVYRAVQPVVEREVAIKIILPQYANQPEFIRRFEAEAQIVARLEHPHIVPLYDYWREPNVAFLIMRLLRGGSLRQLLEKGALPLDIVTRLLEQIGAALGVAHRAGVVHRDLKPANVMLDEDSNAYLADFGIAKNLSNPNLDDQTQADAVVGSPAYISPEQIRSEFVRPQADIYALGVMLYELLTGVIPFSGPTPIEIMHQHLHAPLPPLAANRVGLPKAWDDIIACATAKDPLQRYANVESMLNEARAVSGSQRVVIVEQPAPITNYQLLTPADNPYKGLRAFGEGDAQDFFGREALTTQLLVRLSEGGDLARFLAVIGPSGSGKSSVVEAGLIPALRRGGLPGSENWFIVPMLPGPHPLEELEAALLRIAVNPPDSLLTQLREDKRGLLRAVRRCLPADPNVELVLVIDQFEEVFTLVPAEDEAVRAHLLDSLVTAVLDERSRVRVIVTLRADFTDRPLSYVDFGELLRQRSEFVLPLTPDELEQAIVGPAERVGLRFEDGLVSTIMRDVGDQPGALPLLQYALTELFEKREDNLLTKAAYQAIGGVLGALGRRAEEVYAGLNESDQATARQIFLRLVTLGEGVEDTRRRVLRTELSALTPRPSPTGEGNDASPSPLRGEGRGEGRISAVLDAFGKHRLLTFDRDPLTHGPTVEVAHEALLREWPRLREWLNDSRSDVRWQRTLAEEAVLWNNAQRDASYLLIGAHLEQFAGWALSTTVSLTNDERAYLDASIAERDRQQAAEAERQQRELTAARQLAETERARAEEQTQAANRLRTRNRALAVAGALVTVAAVIAIIFGGQANANATRAETNLTRSEAQRLAAEANSLLQSGGSSELIALLSLRSMNAEYTPQGDAALVGASELAFPKLLFTGNTGGITCLTFSPDGKYVLIGSMDNIVRLRDVRSGQMVHVLAGNTFPVWDAAISPDGKYAVTATDNAAQLWDLQTGEPIRVYFGRLSRVAFSPDGKYILTGDDANTATLWDTLSGQAVQHLLGHTDAVSGVAFSPDGKYILTGSYDKTARLWDAKTGTELRQFIGHTDIIGAVAFSPDGKYVLTGSADETARLWDVQTGNEIHEFSGQTYYPSSVAFSPDGRYVLTGSGTNVARLWNTQTGQELRRYSSGTQFVSGVAFSPDGKSILTGNYDGTARLWDIDSQPELPQFTGHTAAINVVVFSPDSKYTLTGSEDNTARLWDARTGRELHDFVGHTLGLASAVDFSPDGKYVLTGSFDKTIRLWNTATGQELHEFATTSSVRSAAFSPDGKSLVIGSGDGIVRHLDAETGAELTNYWGHVDQVSGVTFSPDGKSIATSSVDKTARLWDVEYGFEQRKFLGHSDIVNSVDISPDGKYLLTASVDKTVRLWDIQIGRPELRQFIGHRDIVWNANFSPDGKYIVSASADGTARLWDVHTGQELRRFAGHTAGVEYAVFSPDGRYILTGSDDKTARLWDVDYHTTMQYLCSRLLRDFTPEERAQYGITDMTPTCPQNQNSPSAP